MLRKKSHLVLLAAFAGAVAMGACSLNPQPIPPGETDNDAGSKFGGNTGETSDAGSNPVASDGGIGSVGDLDASDADAGDASTDDSGDADTDAGDI